MDGELLQSGVWLPAKHCFWKGCAWTGTTNAERCAHVNAKHASKLLDRCKRYYHPALDEEVRVETVLNQVARIKLQQQPPRLSPAQDRRCLRGLHDALEGEDSVQCLI